MIKKLLNLAAAGLLLASTVVTAMPAQAFADHNTGHTGPTGNNGTLKVHEFGTASGTESNDPKVCAFNFEGFNFDGLQEGYIRISTDMSANPSTYELEVPFSADAAGYDETDYINNGGALTLADGKYKATLYGKDTGNPALPNLQDEKAKSKVFIVTCGGYAYASVNILPATCELAEQLVYDNTDLYEATKQSGTDSGTYGPGAYSVTFKANQGFTFDPTASGLNGGGNMQTFSGTLADKLSPTDPSCAPTVVTAEPCVAKQTFLVTNDDEQGFNYSQSGTPWADTRADGDYEYVDGALRLTTLNPVDASSTNKVSGAREVNIPLSEYGGSFAMNFNPSYGTILPGINIRVDADNDGDVDVTLVAEPSVPGYDTFWTNTAGYLPANGGGQGGTYSGDQDDFLALWPNAVVRVEAFALGSGVGTDGDLISWSTPCNTYTYDYVAPPVLDAKASVTVTEGNCEVPDTLTYDTNSWLNAVLVMPGSTPTGATGPQNYSVVAEAGQNAVFTSGAGVISNNGQTQTFQGTLNDKDSGPDCVLDGSTDIPGTPVDTPDVLPATGSGQSMTSLILAVTSFIGLLALGAHLIRNATARSL